MQNRLVKKYSNVELHCEYSAWVAVEHVFNSRKSATSICDTCLLVVEEAQEKIQEMVVFIMFNPYLTIIRFD